MKSIQVLCLGLLIATPAFAQGDYDLDCDDDYSPMDDDLICDSDDNGGTGPAGPTPCPSGHDNGDGGVAPTGPTTPPYNGDGGVAPTGPVTPPAYPTYPTPGGVDGMAPTNPSTPTYPGDNVGPMGPADTTPEPCPTTPEPCPSTPEPCPSTPEPCPSAPGGGGDGTNDACTPVYVQGDATYCVTGIQEGDSCATNENYCPGAGAIATESCVDGSSSYENGVCQLKLDAVCEELLDGSMGCVIPEDDGSTNNQVTGSASAAAISACSMLVAVVALAL